MMVISPKYILACCFVFLFPAALPAQEMNKKPLDHSVYDGWEKVEDARISNNGAWVAYAVEPQAGNSTLVYYNTVQKTRKHIMRGSKPVFTADNRFLIFRINKPWHKKKKDEDKGENDKPEHHSGDTLALLSLQQGSLRKIPRVRSFKIPEHDSGYVVYLIKEKAGKTRIKKKDKAGRKKTGTLVVFNLYTGKGRSFREVSDYLISDDHARVVFSVFHHEKKGDDQPSGMVLSYYPREDNLDTLALGDAGYRQFAFSKAADKVAFLGWKDSLSTGQKLYALYYCGDRDDSARTLVKSYADTGRTLIINGRGKVFFRNKGKQLFFHTTIVRVPPDTIVRQLNPRGVNIWRYNDDYLLPMQLKRKEKPDYQSYLAEINLNEGKIITLENRKISRILLPEEEKTGYALGLSDAGYRIRKQWIGNTFQDAYLISLDDGSRKKIADSVNGRFSISPSGRYVLWYNGKTKNWFTYNILSGKISNITRQIHVPLYDEENDRPEPPEAYGLAGWKKSDKQVWLYDRYDIWAVNPDGSGYYRNITNGYGRKNHLKLRLLKEKRYSKKPLPDSAILLHAFNEVNKDEGYYKVFPTTTNRDPVMLEAGPYKFSHFHRARETPAYIYTKENYIHSPDLYFSGGHFSRRIQLSHINPQQKNYNWGTAGLISWKTFNGKTSQGILYKPEDFDSTRSYPMIVYLYEKLTNRLNNYIPPRPTPSRLNISFFVSRGYLVFCPDISYTVGHPGRSAYNYVISGVKALCRHSWVDSTHIGIQGQSWGGYEVAYLITQTNLFKAAWAGAPVADMFSAYGGIRWSSGKSRQFQYEHGQSRIGASIWKRPDLYQENSPLFHLPDVHTPLMIMSNDNDGSVPWYQGIELFTALRRLNKKAWMLSYKGEEHNLVKRKNKLDISVREQQFFDHFLKGAPLPSWME